MEIIVDRYEEKLINIDKKLSEVLQLLSELKNDSDNLKINIENISSYDKVKYNIYTLVKTPVLFLYNKFYSKYYSDVKLEIESDSESEVELETNSESENEESSNEIIEKKNESSNQESSNEESSNQESSNQESSKKNN